MGTTSSTKSRLGSRSSSLRNARHRLSKAYLLDICLPKSGGQVGCENVRLPIIQPGEQSRHNVSGLGCSPGPAQYPARLSLRLDFRVRLSTEALRRRLAAEELIILCTLPMSDALTRHFYVGNGSLSTDWLFLQFRRCLPTIRARLLSFQSIKASPDKCLPLLESYEKQGLVWVHSAK
jgi:hypothetical protein